MVASLQFHPDPLHLVVRRRCHESVADEMVLDQVIQNKVASRVPKEMVPLAQSSRKTRERKGNNTRRFSLILT